MLITLLILNLIWLVFRRKRSAPILLCLLVTSVGIALRPPDHAMVVAADRYADASARGLEFSQDEARPAHQPAGGLFTRELKLREGTVVPPTVGRVVHLGRRWAFVPLHPSADSPLPPLNELRETTPAPAHARPAMDRDQRQLTVNRGVQLGWDLETAPADHAVTPLAGQRSDENLSGAQRGQYILLCENQMLQRIVESIRADANDDRWEISGEILEFFEDNRLLIRTIQRANSN